MLGSGAEAYRTQICSRQLVSHLLLLARMIVVPGGAILLCLDQHDPDGDRFHYVATFTCGAQHALVSPMAMLLTVNPRIIALKGRILASMKTPGRKR